MTYFLVYTWHGQIKVRECIDEGRTFRPVDKPSIWYTRIPKAPMTLEHGRIYCSNKEQIAECVEIVKNHYKTRIRKELKRSVKSAIALELDAVVDLIK